MPKPKYFDLAKGAVDKFSDAMPEWGKASGWSRIKAGALSNGEFEPVGIQELTDLISKEKPGKGYPGIPLDSNDIDINASNPLGDAPSIMFEGGAPSLRDYDPNWPGRGEGIPEGLNWQNISPDDGYVDFRQPPVDVPFSPAGAPSSVNRGTPETAKAGKGYDLDKSDFGFGDESPTLKPKEKGKPPFGGLKGQLAVGGLTGGLLGLGMVGANREMAGEKSPPDMMSANFSVPNKGKNSGNGYNTFPFDVDMGKVGEVNSDEALARYLRQTAQTAAGKGFKQIGQTPGDNSAQEKQRYQGFLNQSMKLVEGLAKQHGVEYNPQEVYKMAFTKWQDNNKPKKK